MAKRTAEELDEIIRTKLPGYHLARRSAHASLPADADAAPRRRTVSAEETTPSIAALRSKFLGHDRVESDAAHEPTVQDADNEADIVNVEPDDIDDQVRRHTKSVVISAEGDVLGAQG